MNNYPKSLLQLERCAFAVTQAMPELKAAHDTYNGAELVTELDKIKTKYGI